MQTLSLSELSFNPEYTFTSGQTFRWRRISKGVETAWLGVVSGYVVKVTKNEIQSVGSSELRSQSTAFDFCEIFRTYLSFEDDLNAIYGTFPKDKFLFDALKQYKGLRILTQDPWECLVSFVCSINKNIPAIASMIELLSNRFGDKIMSLDRPIHSFPSPSRLAQATKNDLLNCKVGFRWRFVQFIAKQVASGRLDLDSLRNNAYQELRKYLISELSGNTFGVGPKVADCVSLFAYHKREAFPIDVWILRCLKNYYARKMSLGNLLIDRQSLTPRLYNIVHDKAFRYFGHYCGYAQQYLYMKIRADTIRNTMRV